VITMPIPFSPVVAARQRALPGFSSLLYVDLAELGVAASPLAVLDDFRVPGLPFSPHPHAGFAAVTYVFEDSPGDLRSRASLGADLTVGPGGIVWTEAGRGVVHEEVPAVTGRELHGVQLFVNRSARNKLIPPRVLHLDPGDVPEWRDQHGDRVRVVTGAFEGVSSPLDPAEPFTLLDAWLQREIRVTVAAAHNMVVYVLAGSVAVRADGRQEELAAGQALAMSGRRGGGEARLAAGQPAHLLVLSGAEIREPVVTAGPFIMNEPAQIEDATARYRRGEMGHLAPLGGT
jgi:redox-sensitive bicupin YhaK (pirin superfamily)